MDSKPRSGLGSAGYCAHCDREMPDGPDVCLGYIPDVVHACCGHGDVSQAYVCIAPGYPPDVDMTWVPEVDSTTLYRKEAVEWFVSQGYSIDL